MCNLNQRVEMPADVWGGPAHWRLGPLRTPTQGLFQDLTEEHRMGFPEKAALPKTKDLRGGGNSVKEEVPTASDRRSKTTRKGQHRAV